MAVSLVLWSLSTEMRFRLLSTHQARCSRRRSLSTTQSVHRKQSSVPMFGSIMPAPLAMPTMLPAPAGSRRTLGNASVVMMALAMGRIDPPAACPTSAGSAALHFLHRQLPADDPRGGGEEPLTGGLQKLPQPSQQELGVFLPARGSHVGNLVVHQHAADARLRQPLPADEHGGARELVARENRAEVRRFLLQQEQGHVHGQRLLHGPLAGKEA